MRNPTQVAGSGTIPAAGRSKLRTALTQQFAQYRTMATVLVGAITAHRKIGLMRRGGENIQ